jgi:lysophospholipase L1-like esterase
VGERRSAAAGRPPGSRGRSLAGVALLAAASLSAALLLSEILVRIFWDVAQPATERRPPRRALPTLAEGASELPVLESVFELGQKSVRGLHKGLPFRTNRAGFRGPEVAAEPAPGVFRMAVAGDSVTMGTGVLEEETYAARLEQRLNAGAEGVRYEVLNLGLSGLNTEWVVRRIEEIGLPLRPHLVVYGFTLNDIEGPHYVSTIPRGKEPARYRAYRRFADSPSRLLRAVWPRLLALREIVFRPPGTLEHDLEFNYFENERAWADVAAGLDRLAALARERGICAHVLLHTGMAQLNRLYPFFGILRKLEAAARERGLSVSQSFAWFEGKDPTQLRLSSADTHPNAAGHAILAEALLAGLAELPEHCWAAGPGGVPAAVHDRQRR